MTTRMPELSLEVDALERASKAQPGSVQRVNDLPPPPESAYKEKTTSGAYRNAQPVAETAGPAAKPRSNPPNKKPPSTPPKKTSGPPKKPSGGPTDSARYAAARPAAIFGQTRPQQGELDLRRGSHQRQVAGRGHPELPRRGSRTLEEVTHKKNVPGRFRPGTWARAWGGGLREPSSHPVAEPRGRAARRGGCARAQT